MRKTGSADRILAMGAVCLLAVGTLRAAQPKADWVNVGSSTGRFSFDWASAGVRGLNLAACPQGTRRDFAKLKARRGEIADGATVVIPLCPFTSVLQSDYDETHHGKEDNPLLAFDGLPDASALAGFRDQLDVCWKGEFGIRDYADPMTAANRRSYGEMVALMKEVVAWCRAEGLKPVFVCPPAAKTFDALFPDSFMKAYVRDYVRDVTDGRVPFLDFWKSPGFRDDALFANALFLNRTGRRKFTAAVVARLGPSRVRDVIIPRPARIEATDGTCELKSLGTYVQNAAWRSGLSEMVALKLGVPTGLEAGPAAADRAFLRFLDDPSEGKDAYSLTVGADGVVSRASTYGGHFYALQTLLQLLPREVKSRTAVTGVTWTIPCVRVRDAPRFGWRGMMLDVSRHWFTKEEVKSFVDEIAEYKFNVFHWHLTDDQGWRVQIDACPELTAKGSKRAFRVGPWWSYERPKAGETEDYGGFYTKDEIREVIAYAAKRNVDVMPEIDVPGHSLAALVARPDLACLKAPDRVNVGNKFYGEEENSLCAGNEATYRFLETVFGEVSDLFPFAYVHVGGDECFKGFWQKCPKCRKRMSDEKLKDADALQSYLIRRVEKTLAAKGKKLVGWDEILEGGLAESATVMSWRGTKGGVSAAKAGHPVIMTPFDQCYLDLYQGEPSAEPDTYAMCRLSACYGFEPVPDGVDAKLVLGGQGNLWTESVPTFRHAEYMSWPRGWALAETFWSAAADKDWTDFVRRVEEHFRRAELSDVSFAGKSVYNAIVSAKKDAAGLKTVTLGGEIADVVYHYTFDDTNPDRHAPRYSSPLAVPKGAVHLKVQGYRDGRKVGDQLRLDVEKL